MSAHQATEEFVADLFDNYPMEGNRPPRIVTGSHLETIDHVRGVVQERWEDYFGVEIPEELAQQEYLVSKSEQDRLSELRETILLGLNPSKKRELKDKYGVKAWSVTRKAVDIRREVYATFLGYRSSPPDLFLSEPLVHGYPVIAAGYRKGAETAHDIDCAVAVFAMTALRVMRPEHTPGRDFDTRTAGNIIANYPREGSKFDLPWMLGALSTDHAAAKTGLEIKHVLTIGADFGDITKKIIEPLKTKFPGLLFMLNVVLASDTTKTANHAVNVVESLPPTMVGVRDPKYQGYTNMRMRSFWDRWALTNMQAVVTIIRQPEQEAVSSNS